MKRKYSLSEISELFTSIGIFLMGIGVFLMSIALLIYVVTWVVKIC